MSDTLDKSEIIGANLPLLRRFSRALTGNQASGDAYAVATLEAILHDDSIFDQSIGPRAALYKVFYSIWTSSGSVIDDNETGIRARAQKHMQNLTKNTREALLLSTIEGFPVSDVAHIMGVEQSECEHLISLALKEMLNSVSGKVMIIEDEPVIADDLSEIVSELGHAVVGVARTKDEALTLGASEKPEMILADIQLADNSSGIDAVNDLLTYLGDIPVVFITAFPERLLTGDKPEPAFLIPKPYRTEHVRSVVSQAMFFASTETLIP